MAIKLDQREMFTGTTTRLRVSIRARKNFQSGLWRGRPCKHFQGITTPLALAKKFLARMLTRNQFAVTNQ